MRQTNVAACASVLVLMFCNGLLRGNSVVWQNLSEEEARLRTTRFLISPANPTNSDVIHFTDTYDWLARGVCSIEWEIGGPGLTVDDFLKRVRIVFDSPAPVGLPAGLGCAQALGPPTVLMGEFGPLQPGVWEFQSGGDFSRTFTVVPEPYLTLPGVLVTVALAHRRKHRRGLR